MVQKLLGTDSDNSETASPALGGQEGGWEGGLAEWELRYYGGDLPVLCGVSGAVATSIRWGSCCT